MLDYSPTRAGFLQLPFSLLVIGGSIIGSRLVNHFGTRPAMVCGLLTVGIAQIVMTRISAESGVSYVVAGAALSGLGLGCASVASTAGGTSASPDADQGIASGLLNVSAQIGTALGLAVFLAAAALASTAAPTTGDVALVDGYRLAFLLAACSAILAVFVHIAMVRERKGSTWPSNSNEPIKWARAPESCSPPSVQAESGMASAPTDAGPSWSSFPEHPPFPCSLPSLSLPLPPLFEIRDVDPEVRPEPDDGLPEEARPTATVS